MDRRFTALAGILGFTWWRSRRKRAALSPPPPTQPDPADELRAKLAEARDADDREDFEAGETPVDQVDAAETGDLEARRRAVHRDARAAIDEMQGE